MVTFKELYQKAPGLPPYEALDAWFDLEGIAPDARQPAKETSKKVYERLDIFKKVLEDLLQSEHLVAMQESGALTDDERNIASDLLRQIMRLDRQLLLAELSNKDEEYLAFLHTALTEWPKIAGRLRPMLVKIHASWDRTSATKHLLTYLG